MIELYFTKAVSLVSDYPFIRTLILSIGLVLIFLILKGLINRNINKRKLPHFEKLSLKRKSTHYLAYLFLLLIMFLWFSQLQVIFVSILAVAAAIVIALKELIMCITGGVLVKVSHVFKVGHRIEIDGVRGFVIEKSMLTTKVLEVGPEKNSQQTTGDIITIPNSLMLAKSVKNESYFKGYSIKSFVFKIDEEVNVLKFEESVLTLVKSVTADYLENAKGHISKFCEKEGLTVPAITPRTKILVENNKEFSVLVKVPVLNTEIAEIEQKLNRFYLEWRIQHEVKLPTQD